MNRIERISAILIQLQSKKIVKAQEIANRFEISLRTVYRDIRALEETVVPIIGEAGIGYSLVDGYRLPPIMFTKEEALALVTAEKLVEKFGDKSTKNTYLSALDKIKAVLKPTDKDKLQDISDHIQIIRHSNISQEKSGIEIQNILKSIADNLQISIAYFTNYSQEKSTRIVEPVGIFHSANSWYLVAYCLLRNDYRNFKIDRILQLEISDSQCQQKHPPLKTFLERTNNEREVQTIIIAVDKSVLRYLGEEKYYQGFVSQKDLSDGTYELTFLSASIMAFATWYLLFAENAKIIEPELLKTIVKQKVEFLQNKSEI
jgi:predicted DNA-binding transcriptional regulator YafY